ncbi:MAG: hypothetical protein GYA21_20050 [Myxococcales bacterium]|nr:hypothetical protein [Myxococcales bacterium]
MEGSLENGRGPNLSTLNAGDWIGVAMAVLAAAGGAWYGLAETPVWKRMFEDFGSSATLPVWTSIALWRPFVFLIAGLSLGCLAVGLLPRQRGLIWRRGWVVAAFLVGVLGLLFMLWAVRLPIWRLADAIQA